jgi:hypothetical protein
LNGWLAYNSIEPFGEIRDEIRHGQHMALYANCHRDPKKKPEPFKDEDFMNFIDRPEEEDREYTIEELEAYAKRVFGV